jgi:hypothetical protein
MIKQQDYTRSNTAILEALEKNDRDVSRAFAGFMQGALQDPQIIGEALAYYYEGQAEHVRDEMEVT